MSSPQDPGGTPLDALHVGDQAVIPGESRRIEIPVARLPATQTYLNLSVEVIRGIHPGPTLWLSAAIHGDELNGIEIIRQVRQLVRAEDLHGTLLLAPIVNSFGFINESRYLPDRRDLNRSFPGSKRGSLASRMARIFLDEVVMKCSHGIDLHTGSDGRTNLPQIRAELDDPEVRRCAAAFAAPVTLQSSTRDHSLRSAAAQAGKHVLLYEAGEALRYQRFAVKAGVLGVSRVMNCLGMLAEHPDQAGEAPATHFSPGSQWVRARTSGLLRIVCRPGDRVTDGQVLGTISDAFGDMNTRVKATQDGIVIGMTQNPQVRRGDALVHVAR